MAFMQDSEGFNLAFGSAKGNPFELVACADGAGGVNLTLDLQDHKVVIDGKHYAREGYLQVPVTEVLEEFLQVGDDFAADGADALTLAAWLKDYATRLEQAVAQAKVAP